MKSVDELVREECGAHYEQRRILLLRMLAALSDPDLRIHDDRPVTMALSSRPEYTTTATRSLLARANEDNLIRLVSDEWRGNSGPRFTRLCRRAQWLIDALSDDELVAFNEDVYRELARALMG